jgi:hypothetical protein
MTSSDVPTQELFGQQLMQAFIEETGGEFELDLEEFVIHRIDGEGKFFLVNVYAEHCQLPEDARPEHIAYLASTLAVSQEEPPEDYEAARPNLRPKIWARVMIESQNLKQRLEGKPEIQMPFQLIGEHLMLTVVYDTEFAMRSLNRENYEKWGVTLEQAAEDAKANLLQSTVSWAQIGDRVVCSMTGDNYDSARFVLPEFVRAQKFVGDPIALVPDRDNCFLADGGDAESVAMIFKIAEENKAEFQRALSPLPLILKDNAWIDWEPPANHMMRQAFERQYLQFIGGLYAEQKELIKSVAGEEKELPFFATFSSLKGPDNVGEISFCVWSEGVVSYLPKTDVVLFYDQDELINVCRWDDIAEAFGELLVADESFYPVRYLTTGFPSRERLDEVPTVDSDS